MITHNPSTATREEDLANIIVHHIEKLYGEPESIEDYNIVITDATAGSSNNILTFLRDKAFVEINAVEKDPQAFQRLQIELSKVMTTKLHGLYNIDYVENMYLIAQDVVVITPIWDERYQMMRDEELTLSGYPLSDITRMLFAGDRLTSLVVFILPLRYNTETLGKYDQTLYHLDYAIVSVIRKVNRYL
jgi:hypothetical protein